MAGLTERFAHLLRPPFPTVHKVWAGLILLGCVVLALGGGHPPPLVFAPLLILAGLVGHVLLLLIAQLLQLGASRSADANGTTPRWPAELVAIALVLGPLAILSSVVVVDHVADYGMQSRQGLIFVVTAAVHSAAFVALLLRRSLARHLIAVICVAWAVALAMQFLEPRPAGDLAIAIPVICVLLAIAIYVVVAPRIRSALH